MIQVSRAQSASSDGVELISQQPPHRAEGGAPIAVSKSARVESWKSALTLQGIKRPGSFEGKFYDASNSTFRGDSGRFLPTSGPAAENSVMCRPEADPTTLPHVRDRDEVIGKVRSKPAHIGAEQKKPKPFHEDSAVAQVGSSSLSSHFVAVPISQDSVVDSLCSDSKVVESNINADVVDRSLLLESKQLLQPTIPVRSENASNGAYEHKDNPLGLAHLSGQSQIIETGNSEYRSDTTLSPNPQNLKGRSALELSAGAANGAVLLHSQSPVADATIDSQKASLHSQAEVPERAINFVDKKDNASAGKVEHSSELHRALLPRLDQQSGPAHDGYSTGRTHIETGSPMVPIQGGSIKAPDCASLGSPSFSEISTGTSQDSFAALDAESAVPTPVWIHAGVRHAEAGFQDPSLGWVSVRAQLDANGVHAAIVPHSTDAAQALSGHLAALGSFMTTHHAPLQTLTVASPVSEWTGPTSGQSSGEGASHQEGNRSDENQRIRTSVSTSEYAGHAQNNLVAVNENCLALNDSSGGTYISVMV